MSKVPSNISQSYARAVLRLLLLIALAVVMFIPVLVMWMMTLEAFRRRAVCLFYECCSWICGVRLTIEGERSKLRPLLLVANHSSYLDIFVLGSTMPLAFTPKSEIRRWPVIGFFCVLADCVFVERKPADMQRAQSVMAERLADGKVLALFPEGTTGDGMHVKPFKSGFLSLVEEHDLPLQSVSIAYTHIGDQSLSADTRELVAWIGEASLVTHLMRLLSFPYIQVTAKFHAVERIEDHEDRKALAKASEQTIAEGLRVLLEKNGVTG
jgi:1-acyl-sn-glycerol-3-phosphate acyltransferase